MALQLVQTGKQVVPDLTYPELQEQGGNVPAALAVSKDSQTFTIFLTALLSVKKILLLLSTYIPLGFVKMNLKALPALADVGVVLPPPAIVVTVWVSRSKTLILLFPVSEKKI